MYPSLWHDYWHQKSTLAVHYGSRVQVIHCNARVAAVMVNERWLWPSKGSEGTLDI